VRVARHILVELRTTSREFMRSSARNARVMLVLR
jgi:hypothetical protein